MNLKSIDIGIDWDWAKKHLTSRERLAKVSEAATKDELFRHLEECLRAARKLAKPNAVFAQINILKFRNDSIELDGGIILSTKELSKHLKGAESICAYAVTVGSGIEDEASRLMSSGDHLSGYLLDRIGSFAAESMAKNAEDTLRKRFGSQGLSVSMRFSPGYCDWRIEEQLKLAKIIDFEKAGIKLSESCVMIPKKSISAVVGIGPKELFAKTVSPCSLCNMKVCDYRRSD